MNENLSIDECNRRITKHIKETAEHVTKPLEKNARQTVSRDKTTTGEKKETDQRGKGAHHEIHRK